MVDTGLEVDRLQQAVDGIHQEDTLWEEGIDQQAEGIARQEEGIVPQEVDVDHFLAQHRPLQLGDRFLLVLQVLAGHS